jgi:hypothetical protein
MPRYRLPRILEFEFNASGTILLHLPEPWFAMALEGARLAELYGLLCEHRVQRVQEWGESFAPAPPDQPCVRSIETIPA